MQTKAPPDGKAVGSDGRAFKPFKLNNSTCHQLPAGKTLGSAGLLQMPGALLHTIERNGQPLAGSVAKDFVLAEGDTLWFAGEHSVLLGMQSSF